MSMSVNGYGQQGALRQLLRQNPTANGANAGGALPGKLQIDHQPLGGVLSGPTSPSGSAASLQAALDAYAGD